MLRKIKIHLALFISFICISFISLFSLSIPFEMIKGIKKGVEDLKNKND